MGNGDEKATWKLLRRLTEARIQRIRLLSVTRPELTSLNAEINKENGAMLVKLQAQEQKLAEQLGVADTYFKEVNEYLLKQKWYTNYMNDVKRRYEYAKRDL